MYIGTCYLFLHNSTPPPPSQCIALDCHPLGWAVQLEAPVTLSKTHSPKLKPLGLGRKARIAVPQTPCIGDLCEVSLTPRIQPLQLGSKASSTLVTLERNCAIYKLLHHGWHSNMHLDSLFLGTCYLFLQNSATPPPHQCMTLNCHRRRPQLPPHRLAPSPHSCPPHSPPVPGWP